MIAEGAGTIEKEFAQKHMFITLDDYERERSIL